MKHILMDPPRVREIAISLGRAIAGLRSRTNLTQEAVAYATGVGPEAVSRVERGAAIPSLIRLHQYADLFECGLAPLVLPGSDSPGDQALDLTAYLKALPRDEREYLLRKWTDEVIHTLARLGLPNPVR